MKVAPFFPIIDAGLPSQKLLMEIRRRLVMTCGPGAVGNAQKAPKMTCGAKTRAGNPCKKPPIQGRTRCRLHGGLSPKGADHWNFQHGRCTLESRKQTVEGNSYLKQIEELAFELGMIQRKRR